MSGRLELIKRSRQIKRRRKLIKFGGIGFLFLVLFLLVVYTLYRPRWRINEVNVIGATGVNTAEVSSLAKKVMSGSYFLIVPKNSRLFYPEDGLKEELSAAFPRIADFDFEVSGQQLAIKISERKSDTLWCVLNQGNEKDCYFIDGSGLAFAKAPEFTEQVLFEIHSQNQNDNQATSSVIGRIVLPGDTLEKVLDQKAAIHNILTKQNSFERSIIISAEVLSGDNYSFTVLSPILSDQPWQLRTSADMPAESLSELLNTLFASSSFNQNVVKVKQGLSYIDARLASKVFFKISDNHVPPTP